MAPARRPAPELMQAALIDLLIAAAPFRAGRGMTTPREALARARDAAFLGKGLAEMGRALRFDQDFETKIREQIAAEERQKAANVAGKAAKKAGISEASRKEIEETILGLKR